MATHEFPQESKRPLITYLCHPDHRGNAIEAADILDNFPTLCVWRTQYPKDKKYTCWYVGDRSKEEPLLLNVNSDTGNVKVEFRYSQYLPDEIFDELKEQVKNVRYVLLNPLGKSRVIDMIRIYLDAIHEDFQNSRLKIGGRSFAEDILYRMLSDIFPDDHIQRNIRPDFIRSEKGKPLEFDLYIPSKKLAIEVQGPQHFRKIYGDNQQLKRNDQTKKESCKKNDIKLIWFNWEGLSNELFIENQRIRENYLDNFIRRFLRSQHCFVYWQSMEEAVFE